MSVSRTELLHSWQQSYHRFFLEQTYERYDWYFAILALTIPNGFSLLFFFLRHFSNVNVKFIVKTIKFKFNRWWKPPYFITCGDENFLLSPSCKVFGAIFFADYFGTDLLEVIFFNSDTNIDYFFILIQTSIFKACVLSKAVREFVSYLPHTAAGHNTPILCT